MLHHLQLRLPFCVLLEVVRVPTSAVPLMHWVGVLSL